MKSSRSFQIVHFFVTFKFHNIVKSSRSLTIVQDYSCFVTLWNHQDHSRLFKIIRVLLHCEIIKIIPDCSFFVTFKFHNIVKSSRSFKIIQKIIQKINQDQSRSIKISNIVHDWQLMSFLNLKFLRSRRPFGLVYLLKF